jgi:hypothetical protein
MLTRSLDKFNSLNNYQSSSTQNNNVLKSTLNNQEIISRSFDQESNTKNSKLCIQGNELLYSTLDNPRKRLYPSQEKFKKA